MKKSAVFLPEIKLVGITTRTNNAEILANPNSSKITSTIQKYFHVQIPAKINNRCQVGKTFCAYTDYEKDLTGNYTFFIGEQVSKFEQINEKLETLNIPGQNYAKFTSNPGPMPQDLCRYVAKYMENDY